MQILLTGATGFIGSHLLERLLERGDFVCALVRSQGMRARRKLKGFAAKKRDSLISGSITDPEAVALATKGVDVVYHPGWQCSSLHTIAIGRQAQGSHANERGWRAPPSPVERGK
jgi:nucleoside-diphosphate-sugar epimerase